MTTQSHTTLRKVNNHSHTEKQHGNGTRMKRQRDPTTKAIPDKHRKRLQQHTDIHPPKPTPVLLHLLTQESTTKMTATPNTPGIITLGFKHRLTGERINLCKACFRVVHYTHHLDEKIPIPEDCTCRKLTINLTQTQPTHSKDHNNYDNVDKPQQPKGVERTRQAPIAPTIYHTITDQTLPPWTTEQWHLLVFKPLRRAIKTKQLGPQLKLIAMLSHLAHYPLISIPEDIQLHLNENNIGTSHLDIMTFLHYDLMAATTVLPRPLTQTMANDIFQKANDRLKLNLMRSWPTNTQSAQT